MNNTASTWLWINSRLWHWNMKICLVFKIKTLIYLMKLSPPKGWLLSLKELWDRFKVSKGGDNQQWSKHLILNIKYESMFLPFVKSSMKSWQKTKQIKEKYKYNQNKKSQYSKINVEITQKKIIQVIISYQISNL